MSLNTNGFKLPVYIVKGIATSGHVADLAPLQIGVFDKKTNSIATASGNGVEFYIAGGSPHTKNNLSKFYGGLKQRKETEPFSGKDIISFHKILPTKASHEQWVLGYDGSLSSKSLKFEADKTYKLKIRLFGESVFRAFNKSLEKVIPLYTGASTATDCEDDCLPEYIGVKKQTLKWIDAINNNVELKELKVQADAVFSDYVATTPNRFVYNLTVSDNGGVEALQDIQRAYPTETVVRTNYQNGKSVYEIEGKTSAPTAYTPKVFAYAVENCDECVSGIFAEAQYTYIVRRQLASDTDLDDATAETAFAAAVVSDYSGVSGSGVYLGKSDGQGLVKFRKTTAVTAPASGTSDTVEEIAMTPAQCTPSSASPVSWVSVASGHVGTRTAKITLSTEDCSQSYTTTSVGKILGGVLKPNSYVVTDVTDNAESCVQVFQVVQDSDFTQDLYCMTKGTLVFRDLPNFGHSEWKIVESPEAYNANIKAGIRFTAPFISELFGDCAYDLDEYWDKDPVRMEVALLLDGTASPAEIEALPVAKRVKAPSYQRGYGVGVRRTYIKRNSAYFPTETFESSARMREAIDNTALAQVKADAYYVEYVLTYKSLRNKTNQKQETWATPFFIEAGDLATQVAFENSMQSVTSKFGVNLELLG